LAPKFVSRDLTPPTAAAVIAVLTLIATWPLALRLTDSLPGDYGDPVFVSWAIGWVSGTLTDALAQPTALGRLWDANIFFPERQTLAFSEHFIGQALIALPFYWASGNLLLAYNVAFLSSFLLTGLGTFLLTRALIASAAGSLVAAVIATFNEYRLVWELSHLHVLSIYWLPFALLGLHRYFETDARRYLVGAGAALVALTFSSIYYVAYSAPLIAIFIAFELSAVGRWRNPRVWLELWATAAVVVVATLPVVLPYLEVYQRLGITRSTAEVMQYSATVDQYWHALGGLLPALALAVVSLVAAASGVQVHLRWVITLSLVLVVVSFWLSLGPSIQFQGEALPVPSLYQWLYELMPGYKGLRVPARFAAAFLIFLGILGGAGVTLLERRWPGVVRATVVPMVVVLVVWTKPYLLPLNQPIGSAGLAIPPPYLTPAPTAPPIYQTVTSLTPGAILVEFPFGDAWYDLRYMYFAAGHRRRLLNGYSGVFPPSFVERQRVLARPALDPAAAARVIRGATHAVVHRAAWPDNSGLVIGAWLEALGARVIAEHDGALLYELALREELAEKQKGTGPRAQGPGKSP
jgi:hypothetical protein